MSLEKSYRLTCESQVLTFSGIPKFVSRASNLKLQVTSESDGAAIGMRSVFQMIQCIDLCHRLNIFKFKTRRTLFSRLNRKQRNPFKHPRHFRPLIRPQNSQSTFKSNFAMIFSLLNTGYFRISNRQSNQKISQALIKAQLRIS